MTILELLKKDHKVVKDILKELGETPSGAIKTKSGLFRKLKNELVLHEKIEETIFYPPLKKHKETKDLILEAYEEHHVVDLILQELEELEPKEESWMPKLTVLKENLEHHIHEEEKELFPKVKKILDQATLIKMGEEMQLMKLEENK
jgi:iron-sulfur cluster repair protein YtfE (RIC family)